MPRPSQFPAENPWGQGPWNNGQGGKRPANEPNFDDFINKGKDKLKRAFPGGKGGRSGSMGILLVLLIAFGLWLFSGFYRVNSDEIGIELTFGKWSNEAIPSTEGLHYHFPYPIGSVEIVNVTAERRVSITDSSAVRSTRRGRGDQFGSSNLMLTGDENIIDVEFTAVWRIKNAGHFLFEVMDAPEAVKRASESAMRDVIGQSTIDAAMSRDRGQIQVDVRNRAQEILDSYKTGIILEQILLEAANPPAQAVDAFRDVQRAQTDSQTMENQATAYRNDIIPKAQGQAFRIKEEAEAYKQQTINRAKGDAERFKAVLVAYRQDKDVTTTRLYLETMQEVLSNATKLIVDDELSGGSGVLPYLSLDSLRNNARTQ